MTLPMIGLVIPIGCVLEISRWRHSIFPVWLVCPASYALRQR
jgi:hypothetical protein